MVIACVSVVSRTATSVIVQEQHSHSIRSACSAARSLASHAARADSCLGWQYLSNATCLVFILYYDFMILCMMYIVITCVYIYIYTYIYIYIDSTLLYYMFSIIRPLVASRIIIMCYMFRHF